MIGVIGGHGFIGRSVCATLMARGYDVIVCDTRSSYAIGDKCPYPTVACDIRRQADIEQIFCRYPVTTLIHLASMLNTASRQQTFEAVQVNILGSLNLLEAARRCRVAKFIYGSSISVYGAKETSVVDDRELLAKPPAPDNLYGMSKRYVEMLGNTYQQQFGGQFVALRIASVIGPGARSSSSPWRSEIFEKLGGTHAAVIDIPYSYDAQLPLVFVEDVARMMVCLVEATHLSRLVYNTPAERWTMQTLGAFIESLAPHLRVTFGHSKTGNPTTISGQEFRTEFGYASEMSIRERLQRTRDLKDVQQVR